MKPIVLCEEKLLTRSHDTSSVCDELVKLQQENRADIYLIGELSQYNLVPYGENSNNAPQRNGYPHTRPSVSDDAFCSWATNLCETSAEWIVVVHSYEGATLTAIKNGAHGVHVNDGWSAVEPMKELDGLINQMYQPA